MSEGYKSNDSHKTDLDTFQMTKNNVMAIISNTFMSCMTYVRCLGFVI